MSFLKILTLSISLFIVSNKGFSQCFEIESILVDACDNGADEAYNEMFRMKIGGTALNTSNLNINWPAQTWLGLVRNATTASKVSQLNAAIIAAGGCGQILEPTGGVLPANATVIVVTSPNLDTTLNSFGALTSTIYMIFQNTPSNANAGHFGNYNATPATRTLTVSFGAGCSDSVTYQRANLVNIFGTVGGSISDLNGSTVNFTASGTASYVNNGCIAPIQPFTVEAGTTPISACAGQTINLSGAAQGQTSVLWSSAMGSFSTPNNSTTTYSIPASATAGSSINLILTATNSCGATITDQITINISGSTLTLDSANNNQNICSGNAINPIQYTFGGGATSATVTGLPTGVTATTSGNTVTISGTPTSPFSYTVNTFGGCGAPPLEGTITFSTNPTLTLDSANNNQDICSGNAINPIQYTFGGGATSATVIGLPTGVTATTSGNTVTINGNTSINFMYSIITVGGCGSTLLDGNVVISSNSSMSIISAPGTNNQTICLGNPMDPIRYTFGDGATSTNITGLPTGVTASTSGNTVTISGTPISSFSYSINTVGGCGTIILNGTVSISSNSTLALDSANNTQNICSGNTITPIHYTFGGGATSVNVTGLPTGVTASTSGNTVTISGTPASGFSYSINTVGGCGTVTLNGTISLSTNATLTLNSGNNTQSICSGNAITPIQYTFGGGVTSVNVTGLPTGVTASTSGNTVTISGTPISSFSYSINTVGGCGTIILNGTVSISSNATLTLDSANNIQSICSGNAITLVQYTFGGGATNVNVSGLPTGVTATTSGNTVIINGNPTGVIGTPYNYTVTTYGGCGFQSLTGTITLTNGTIPTFVQVLPMCAGATSSPLPTISNEGITGTWSPAFNNTTTTTYTFTPNAGQCAVNTQMTIQIYPAPTVVATNLNPIFCTGGTTNIQLTSNVPGAIFSWTVTGGNVVGAVGGTGISINQLLTVSAGTTATVQVTYTIVAEINNCVGPAIEITVQVNPIPDLTVASSTAPICSGETTNISFTGTIPGTVFTWVVTSPVGISGASNGTGTSIQQVLSTTGLSQGSVTYEITPTFNGCTGTPQSVTVLVNPRPELYTNPTHPPICSGEITNISVGTYNNNTVLTWTVNPVGVSGALSGTNTGLSTLIAQVLTTTGNAPGYVDYTITPSLAGCTGTSFTVRVVVNPLPEPKLVDGAICVDEFGVPFQSYTLDSGLDNATYDFVWYFNGVAIPNSNNATYTANAVGTYGVIATNSSTNCVSSDVPNMVTATVTSVTPAASMSVTQSAYFSGNATLTADVTGGSGTLMYSLDEGTLQASNVFTNVSAGFHTITVIDTQGCTYLTYTVFVIEYPQYFTPNGDGINDGWYIAGLQDTDVIYIFDRYGKLIKQLRGIEKWDGTYNQEQLPSTDYWFTVDYLENGAKKQFKAHFAIKR